MKYCKKCKKEYPENEKFCGECGKKLTKLKDNIKEDENKKVPRQNVGKADAIKIMSVLLVIGLLLLFYFYGINNSLHSELSQASQNTDLSKQNSDKCSAELSSVKTDLSNCQQSISSFLNTKAQNQNNIADCKNSIDKTNSVLLNCNSQISSVNLQLTACNSQLQVYGGCA